jgi:Gluconate 2-dehydrogenase subunit 3
MHKYFLPRRKFLWRLIQSLISFLIASKSLDQFSAKALAQKKPDETTNFTKDEFDIVESITSIIIPSDVNPGAREAHVAEYVVQVFQIQGSDTVSAVRSVLSAINKQSLDIFSAKYNSLNQQQQKMIVNFVASSPQLSYFWSQLRTLTVLRFYSLPVGYKPTGLPGPNVDKGGFPKKSC